MSNLNQKVIWITGASSGIGEQCAYRFAKEKYFLILTALEEDLLANVKEKCLLNGASDVAILPFNLSNLAEIENLTTQAWQCFGKIDIIYNNAGISQRSDFLNTEISVFQRIMNVNFYAPVMITHNLLPLMIKNGGGQLVVTTSIAGKFGFPLRSAYSSSKHALYGFFETIAAEYYKDNIRVTFVCPGRVQTRISFYALEKDGQQHGKMDAGQANGITPEKAASQIYRAISSAKREILVGKKELLMVYIKKFFPAIATKLIRKIKSM